MKKKKQNKSRATASSSGASDVAQQLETLFVQYDINYPIKKAILDKQKKTKPTNAIPPASEFPPLKGSRMLAVRLKQNANIKKIPPIIICEEADFLSFKEFAENNTILYRMTKNYDEKYAIIPDNIADYNAAIDYLQGNTLGHYTYSFGSEKNLKVVMRGVPPNYPDHVICMVLKRLYDYPVIAVHRMDRKPRKVPLVLVTLPRTDTAKKIFQMTEFCGNEVKVEKKDEGTRQCHRCQRFGHNSSHCSSPFVCVRCSGPHQHTQCKLAPSEPAKCANCSGDHPANFRKCPTFKLFNVKKFQQKEAEVLTQLLSELLM